MTENRVMKLWTAVVTAFLALFTALGFVAPAAAAPAQTGPTHTGSESAGSGSADSERTATAPTADVPALSTRDWPHARSLPPTMKQRIRAEAHGKSPSCRHRPLVDTETEAVAGPTTTDCAAADGAEASIPLQR